MTTRDDVLEIIAENLELSNEVESSELGPNGLVLTLVDGSEWLVPKPRQVRAASVEETDEEDDDDEDDEDEDDE